MGAPLFIFFGVDVQVSHLRLIAREVADLVAHVLGPPPEEQTRPARLWPSAFGSLRRVR